MSERLDTFQKAFEKYRDKFELHSYKTTFREAKTEAAVATIHTNSQNFKADITVSDTQSEYEDLKASAKHEALHLLVARFSELAGNRFASENEIEACEEELVRKLAYLIPDIE
jgi:hypothetical protein